MPLLSHSRPDTSGEDDSAIVYDNRLDIEEPGQAPDDSWWVFIVLIASAVGTLALLGHDAQAKEH